MTTTLVTLIGDVTDAIAEDFDPRRTKAYVRHNTSKIVTDDGPIHLGGGTVNVESDGTFTLPNVVASTSLVENLQATVYVDYADPTTRQRVTATFGPYDLSAETGTVDISDLEAVQALDPSFASETMAAMQELLEESQAVLDAQELISGLTGEDDAVALLINTPSSDTAGALTLSTADSIESGETDPQTAVDTRVAAQVDPVKQFPMLLAPGRKWAFMGDSITAGTGAAAGRRFAGLVPWLVGTAHMAPLAPLSPASSAVYSVDGGVAGERSDQILARVDAVIAQSIHGMVLLAGANDANQSVAVTTFMTNIQAIATKCRAAGIPLVVGMVPPRSSTVSTAIRRLVAAYNLALREWAPRAGVRLADTYTPLANQSDGALNATYAYDDIHPNTNGHRLIAIALSSVVTQAVVTQPLMLTAKHPLTLGRNPLFQTDESFWSEQPGGTGTAPTYSRVADTTGKLPSGAYWEQMDFDNVSGVSGTRSRTTSLNAGSASFTAGDKLLITYQMEIEDIAGFATAANADPNTAAVLVRIINGTSGSAIATGVTYQPTLGQSPGPSATILEVPVGVTSLVLWVTVTVPTAVHVKVRFSAIDVINLTTAGLAGTY